MASRELKNLYKEIKFWEGDEFMNNHTRNRPSTCTSYQMGKNSKKPAAKKATESPPTSDSEELSRPSTLYLLSVWHKRSKKKSVESFLTPDSNYDFDILPSDSEVVTSATLEEMEVIDGAQKKKAKKSKAAKKDKKREKEEKEVIKRKPPKKTAKPPLTPHWQIAEDDDEETAEAIRCGLSCGDWK